MKIAILSDIHGNIRALKAVVAECRAMDVSHYFVLGDVIGYYFDNFEVIKYLKEIGATVIRGNHEDMFLKAYVDEAYLVEITSKYGRSIYEAIHSTHKEEIYSWIQQLSYEHIVEIDSITFKMIHGNYENWHEYVYPNSPKILLEKYCDMKYDFVFLGHSHYNFVYHQKKCLVVNVGSVGMNKMIGGLASWVLLDTTSKTIVNKTTPYDYLSLINDVENKYTENKVYLVDVLLRNR